MYACKYKKLFLFFCKYNINGLNSFDRDPRMVYIFRNNVNNNLKKTFRESFSI